MTPKKTPTLAQLRKLAIHKLGRLDFMAFAESSASVRPVVGYGISIVMPRGVPRKTMVTVLFAALNALPDKGVK